MNVEGSRAQVTALLAATLLVAACSHKQDRSSKVAPAPQSNPHLAAYLNDLRDIRCADEFSGTAALPENGHRIVQIAHDGKVFLARKAYGQVAVWDADHGVSRLLDRRLDALAEDGSVGLVVVPGVGRGVVLEVWDLSSNRKLGSKTFELGLAPGWSDRRFLTVSRHLVVLREDALPYHSDGVIEHPPSPSIVQWSVATGKFLHHFIDGSCGEDSWLSRDGRYHLCISESSDHVSWSDFRQGAMDGLFPAPDWRPLPTKVDEEFPMLRSRHPPLPPSILHIRSARLSREGSAVYLTYEPNLFDHTEGSRAPRRGWRLEKWTPRREGDGPDRVTLLASSPDRLCTSLLAASPDDRLLIFGGLRVPATVRHAPEYQATPLGKDTEIVAAGFSSDGTRFVTGHADGHLELWSSKTLQSIQSTHPAWSTAGH